MPTVRQLDIYEKAVRQSAAGTPFNYEAYLGILWNASSSPFFDSGYVFKTLEAQYNAKNSIERYMYCPFQEFIEQDEKHKKKQQSLQYIYKDRIFEINGKKYYREKLEEFNGISLPNCHASSCKTNKLLKIPMNEGYCICGFIR